VAAINSHVSGEPCLLIVVLDSMPGCNAYSRNGCSQGDIHIAVACFTQRKMVSLHRENATIADVITFVNMHGFAFFSTLRKDVLHGVCRADSHEVSSKMAILKGGKTASIDIR
jgi:hypothetical protein